MATKKIKIAIIGLGYWGPNLLRNFYQIDNCEVKYGCDLSSSILKKYSLQYPNVKFTKNYSEILKDKDLDAICIATPLSTHHKLARLAIEYGKHVFLEKPMTSCVKEAEELINLAKKKKLLLVVDHTFIFTSAVRKIKELISSKKLGKIYYFDSERINLGLIQPDINVIWDLAPHDISIMQYIFEGMKPVYVFASATKHINNKFEEMAHITIDYDSGVVGHIHVSWLSPVKIRKILIGGSKKMIIYNDIDPTEKIKIYDKGILINKEKITPFNPVYRSGEINIPKLDDSEALKLTTQHFINYILGNEKPLIDGEKGLVVVKLLEACDKSIARGTKIKL